MPIKDKGGAARAAYRLFLALKKADVKVECIYQDDNHNRLKTMTRLINILCNRPWFWLFDRCFGQSKKPLFSKGLIGSNPLFKTIQSSQCDVVHLHWPNAATLSVKQIATINKPVVWSLHDI